MKKQHQPKVFKFGGASIASAELMRNVAHIVSQFQDEQLAMVVSAMGKTTNSLEEVVTAYFKDSENASQKAKEIFKAHRTVCAELLANPQQTIDKINNFFVEIDWLIEDQIETNEAYVYDQIVSIGELCSTTILADFLIEKGLPVVWLDARELIHTDDVYQQASINWEKTSTAISKKAKTLLIEGKIVITQGFIGSTSDNNTTTLGREGSDFTGAILAHCLDAESLTIWKDVAGVFNADPRWLPNTVRLEEMNYREAVEQSYYGAKVIHPKTLKPLQNKGIPLHVRSFKDLEQSGTTIQADANNQFEQPVYVLKKNQVLLHCYTKDFSFFDNAHINRVMKIFDAAHCHLNLLQNGAVQCSFVFDYDEDMVELIHNQLSEDYIVKLNFPLELLTIRHYNKSAIDQMTNAKDILLEQRSPINYQALYRQ